MTPFNGPLGLALSGGGAHGAWQAGAMRALSESLRFDKVLGFSAGALSGVAYALGLQEVLAEKWRNVDAQRVLRFRPKLGPLTLFSGDPLWESVRYASDEAEAKRTIRCELNVVSLRVPQGDYDYARFTPGGTNGWDGPLPLKLVASCAIPGIFPNVIHRPEGGPPQRLIDGGVPGKEWMRFDPLASCRTVVALQMTRPQEYARWRLFPWDRFEQTGRDICYKQTACGIDSLLAQPAAPTVLRLFPSRRLDFSQLSFRSSACLPAMDLGYEDARRFLADPEPYLIRHAILAPSPAPAPARVTKPAPAT